jgi:hypothetical protein
LTVGSVAALTALGLWLRATGAGHGLPYVHHPDVPKQLHELRRFLAGDWIPDTVYPMLHVYLAAVLLDAQQGPQAVTLSPAQIALALRLQSAALSAAAIPLAYLTGAWLWGRAAGLWAAALTALSALHVLHGHYAMGDATHMYLVAAAVAAGARALATGAPGGVLVGGLLAGLAASAKFYGGVVVLAPVVAALAIPRPRRQRLLAGAAALLLAVAAFALATPRFLEDPGGFLLRVRDGADFGRPLMPPWLERPGVVAGALGALALDWLEPGVLLLAAIGAAVTARTRPAVAALLLAPPAAIVSVYVATRSTYLDDRNLLALSPFVYFLAAFALAWGATGSRLRRLATAGAGLAVLGTAAVDAFTVAHLFRQEDTRTAALRWADQRLGPGARQVAGRHYDSREAARPEGAEVLRLDTYDYWRHLYRYTPLRLERAERAAAFFETQGKLLKRFELLPRSFTAPTLAYYDLASMDVPHAFPPPDDVARPETIVFADPDAVPDRASVVVPGEASVTQTVVSRAPLGTLAVALSGRGRVWLEHGGQRVLVRLDPGALHVEHLSPRRAFPWYKYFYPVTVQPLDGWTLARILVRPCEVAWAHLAYEEFALAVPHLDACRGTRWVEPSRLFDLAWAQARLGDREAARRALQELEAAAPGLFGALRDLAGRPDGAAWRERYRTLAGHGPWFWHAHTVTFRVARPGGEATHELGFQAAGHLRTVSGSPPGTLKVWFDRDFLRGPFQVRFRLRGESPDGSPVARLEVVRHFQRQVLDVAQSRDWTGTGGERLDEVVLPVDVELEPARLEARVRYHGRGWLEVEEIAVVPDVRRALRAKLAALEPFSTAGRLARP